MIFKIIITSFLAYLSLLLQSCENIRTIVVESRYVIISNDRREDFHLLLVKNFKDMGLNVEYGNSTNSGPHKLYVIEAKHKSFIVRAANTTISREMAEICQLPVGTFIDPNQFEITASVEPTKNYSKEIEDFFNLLSTKLAADNFKLKNRYTYCKK